jgi:putative transposase
VRFAFIDTEKANYPIAALCRVLEVTRQGFYAWKARGEGSRRRRDRALAVRIRAVHAEHRGRYGSPRVYRELRANGVCAGRHRVARLMREEGLYGLPVRRYRRTTDSNHGHVVAPNLIERDFSATGPNQLWLGDITYLPLRRGGFAYLAVLMDAFSRRIVGFCVDDNMTAELCIAALRQAVALRAPPAGLVHHTDRGVQYACDAYRHELKTAGFAQSMSRKGDCWDNAPMESFFGRFKTELIHERAIEDVGQARALVTTYISGYYNPRRRHSALRYASPIDYEQEATAR